jgi:hypothetical protein
MNPYLMEQLAMYTWRERILEGYDYSLARGDRDYGIDWTIDWGWLTRIANRWKLRRHARRADLRNRRYTLTWQAELQAIAARSHNL